MQDGFYMTQISSRLPYCGLRCTFSNSAWERLEYLDFSFPLVGRSRSFHCQFPGARCAIKPKCLKIPWYTSSLKSEGLLFSLLISLWQFSEKRGQIALFITFHNKSFMFPLRQDVDITDALVQA